MDHLIDSVQENYDDDSSDFYQCLLGTDHIGANSSKLKSPDFTSGVIKIQNGEHSSMTQSEHRACTALKAKKNNSTNDSKSVPNSYEELLNRRKKVKLNNFDYVNCDFILGSTACVERLWSIAKEILHGPRNRTSPIIVEALLFLRENRRLWSINDVVEATAIVTDNRLSQRQKEKENNLDHHEEMEGDDMVSDDE